MTKEIIYKKDYLSDSLSCSTQKINSNPALQLQPFCAASKDQLQAKTLKFQHNHSTRATPSHLKHYNYKPFYHQQEAAPYIFPISADNIRVRN